MEYNPCKLTGQSAEKTFYTTQVRFWPGVFKRCAVWGYKRVGNDIQETSRPRFQSNLSESTISCYRFEHICTRMCTWQSIQIHRRDNPKRKAFRNSPPRLQLQHLFVGTLGTFWRNQPRDTSLENPPTKISARKLCVCVCSGKHIQSRSKSVNPFMGLHVLVQSHWIQENGNAHEVLQAHPRNSWLPLIDWKECLTWTKQELNSRCVPGFSPISRTNALQFAVWRIVTLLVGWQFQ